jgi:hypothetical protein
MFQTCYVPPAPAGRWIEWLPLLLMSTMSQWFPVFQNVTGASQMSPRREMDIVIINHDFIAALSI